MKKSAPLFGLRFGANENIQPTPAELESYAAALRRQKARVQPAEPGRSDYRELLKKAADYQQRRQRETGHQDIREFMFYGILEQSGFIHRTLPAMVDLYHYHLHTLSGMDFKKPTAFIRSAEEEIGKLSSNKKTDAARIGRLQDMVDERKKALDKLERSWAAVTAELVDIAQYIKDNLGRISTICEASIVILLEVQMGQKKELQLIEDIKTLFKENLRDTLQAGPLTRDQLEAARQEVTILTKELADLLRNDTYSMTKLLEAIHDHAERAIRSIKAVADRIDGADNEMLKELFSNMATVLDALMTEFTFELHAGPARSETPHKAILEEKRKEFIDHVFDLLKRDRRALTDRRSGEDRRTYNDPYYPGPERRNGKDRRSGRDRRNK